jgi:hypothetical protein
MGGIKRRLRVGKNPRGFEPPLDALPAIEQLEGLTNDGENETLRELKKILDEIPLPNSPFEKCYQTVIRSMREVGKQAHTVARMAEILNGFGNDGKSRVAPMLEFAERVGRIDASVHALNQKEARVAATKLKQLLKWVEGKISPQRLADLRCRIDGERQKVDKKETVSRIVMDLYKMEGLIKIDCWMCNGSGFEKKDGRSCADSPESVRQAVESLLNDVQSDAEGEIFLEFLLSFENSRLEIDYWKNLSTKACLGAAYPVVLRWRTRHIWRDRHMASEDEMTDKQVKKQKLIVDHWKKVSRKVKESNLYEISWVASNYDVSGIFPLLHKNDYGKCVGLSFAPHEKPELGEILQYLLVNGAPYALWPRRAFCSDAFKDVFSAALTAGEFDEFPDQVRCLRERAIRDQNHPCAAISVLWDDPDSPMPPLAEQYVSLDEW